MKTLILGLSTLIILTAAACNSSVETGTGGTGGSGSTGTQSTGTQSTGTQSTGSGVPGGCPAAEPSNGSSCAGVTDGLQCTYGDSTRPECRDVWMCKGGMWNTTGSVCAMSTDCGTTEPAMGTVCGAEGAVCSFGSDICICSSCSGGGPCMAPPPKWTCAGPPTTAGCPPIAPNNGSACSQAGLSCTYGFPCGSSGVTAECKDGAWTWDATVACPD